MKGQTLGVIFLIIAGIVVVAAFTGQFPLGCPGCLGGSQVLALSLNSFQSSHPLFNGPAYLGAIVISTPGGLAQTLTGTVASGTNVQGTQTTAPLSISFQNTEFQCKSVIQLDSASPQVRNWGFQILPGCNPLNVFCNVQQQANIVCGPLGQVEAFGSLVNSFDGFCIYSNPVGSLGNVPDRGDPEFNTEVRVQAGSSVDIKSLSSEGPISAQFDFAGQPFAQVNWVGNLVTGDSCPSSLQQNVRPFHDGVNWKFVDRTRVNDYQIAVSGFAGTTSLGLTGTDLSTLVNNLNFRSNLAQLPVPYVSTGGVAASTSGAVSGGEAIIIASNIPIAPLVTMIIKAETLGILTPVPQVSSLTCTNLNMNIGQIGTSSVTFTNVGQEQGTFTAQTICPSGFSVNNPITTLTLQPGQEGNVFPAITASGLTQTTTESCSTTVTTLQNVESCNFQVTANTVLVQICQANTIRCVNQGILQCNEFGTAEVLIEDCGAAGLQCQASGSSIICGDPQPFCGDGICQFGEQLICPADCPAAPPGPVIIQPPIPTDPLQNFLAQFTVGLIVAGAAIFIAVFSGFGVLIFRRGIPGVIAIALIIALIVVFLLGGFSGVF